MSIRQQLLEMFVASHDFESPTVRYQLMELIVERENMARALKRVRRNKGKPGVDGMTVDQLPSYLKRHWPKIIEDLLNGRYKPFPVRRKEISKPDGGVRLLGIPTVLARLIQQATAYICSKYGT